MSREAADMQARRGVTIVVPFYKNPELVGSLFDSLERCLTDLQRLKCTIVGINDSPGFEPLRAALHQAAERLRRWVPVVVLENEANVGFVKSANRGLRTAMEVHDDVLLLNSDTEILPGALAEIQSVAYLDPMIGFVSPRSNNATICSFPVQDQYRSAPVQQAGTTFEALAPSLPRFHYVPTAVGFCMYIKEQVLSEFGLFDESYGKGYNEENDLVMRANRAGYRAALANRAFVYHMGEASFSLSDVPKSAHEEKNAALLSSRYPEYFEKVEEYFSGPRYRAEVLAAGLIRDFAGRPSVVFDFSTVGAYHNGTFEAARELLTRAGASWSANLQVHVIANEDAARFHRLHEIPNVFVEPVDTKRVFAAAVRIGQPFEWPVIERMAALAPVNIYGMLDTIAWDCLYLDRRGDLDAMWRFVFEHADGVFYISRFVEQQFRTRFRMRPSLQQAVCYLSTDVQDYGHPHADGPVPGHILVVGNSFAHKRVPFTIRALSHAFPDRRIVAVGVEDVGDQNVICYSSGHLPAEFMDNLYAGASVVVFPSTYEGFGIPIMKALAFHKPLLARDIPVTAELHDKLGNTPNLIRYSSTTDLIRRLREGWPQWIGEDEARPSSAMDWNTVADQMREFVLENVRRASLEQIVIPRLTTLGDLRYVLPAPVHEPQHDDGRAERAVMRESEVEALRGSIATAEKALAERESAVAQRDATIADREAVLAQRTAALAAMQEELGRWQAAHTQLIHDHKVSLAEREARITSLQQSMSWVVTAPLRSVGRIWLRLFGS